MSSLSLRLDASLASAAAATLLFATPAFAGSEPAPAPAATSPFLGEWELDLARMPTDYGTPPKRVTYRFEDIGSGKWRTAIDITAPDDSVRHMAVSYRRDGVAMPGEGDTGEADSAAIATPSRDVLVMTLGKAKRLGSVRVYTVTAGGREMIESAANVDPNGMPFVRTFHFRRIR